MMTNLTGIDGSDECSEESFHFESYCEKADALGTVLLPFCCLFLFDIFN